MNMNYVKIKPTPIGNKKRNKGKGLPSYLKQKPQKGKELLEWISSWNIWVPIKILCS